MFVRYALFFATFAVVLGGVHYYVWSRLVRDVGLARPWLRAGTWLFGALYVALFGGVIAAWVLPRAVAAPFAWVSYTWLGLLFFLLFGCLTTEIARQLALRALASESKASPGGPENVARREAISRLFGGVAGVIGVGMGGVGMASALSPVGVARVRVPIVGWRGRGGYRIVQISDVHVGPTIGRAFIEQIVAQINALKPDLVAITGDLVDGSVDELREHVAPLANIVAKDGVYFVTGNHEYYSGVDAWCAHLAELGIRVLRNERVSLGGAEGFDLAGIDDMSSRGMKGQHGPDLGLALSGRDSGRPLVLLAHQPKGIELADGHGVDLQLSGHTHGGQLFPWNFMVRLDQPFVSGLHRLAHAHIYVSRGTGYWGPPMRLGAPSEVTELSIVQA